MEPDVLELNLEELAVHIEKLSAVGEKLKSSRLAHRTIRLLIRDSTNVNLADIDAVLAALPNLKSRFLKPDKKKK